MPDNHRKESQMALLMCFPYGILAYRNSNNVSATHMVAHRGHLHDNLLSSVSPTQVRLKAQQGDIEGARASSKLALGYYRRSCYVFILGGLVLLVFLGCSGLFIALVMIIIYGSG